MKIAEALHNHRHTIVDKWVAYTLKTYQATEFLQREQDRFANPIGSTVRSSLKQLFSLLVQGSEATGVNEPLATLMHLRAVQDFTPSQAVAPLNAVKHISREVLGADKQTKALINDLYDFEFAVDLAVLAAFDLYMQCREKVYRIRIDEVKSGSHILTDNACPSKALKNIQEIKK
jgi:hypothetical protein